MAWPLDANEPPGGLRRTPTRAEAIHLISKIASIRDQVNKLVREYYNWTDVRDDSIAERLDKIQLIAFHYSSDHSHNAEVTNGPASVSTQSNGPQGGDE